MKEQLFLFTSLPDEKPAQRQKQLTVPKPPASSRPPQPLTSRQRAELHELRNTCRALKAQVSHLEERYDAAWCVFHRRLDAIHDDGRGARSFAARFLLDVVREVHSSSTAPAERELATRWLRGDDIGGVVSVQDICAFAGVEHSKLSADMGRSIISGGAPRPSIRRL